MKEIPIRKHSLVALVDDCDFDAVSKSRWFLLAGGYAVRNVPKHVYGKAKMETMHRMIACPPEGMEVDHRNGNRLDNRRENLRICTRRENSRNRIRQSNNASGYVGVSWHKQQQKWRAYIKKDYQQIALGLFDNRHEAAMAYNIAALSVFGEFAKLNQISAGDDN